MSQAGRDKLLLSDSPVTIAVHLSKGRFEDCLLRHVRLLSLQEDEHILHQPLHLGLADLPVVIAVEYSEDVLETLVRGSLSDGVIDHTELGEVDTPATVGIKDPEDMVLHLLDIFTGLSYGQNLPELLPVHLAVRVDRKEISEIVLYLNPLHPAPLYDGLDTVLGEDRLPRTGPHAVPGFTVDRLSEESHMNTL